MSTSGSASSRSFPSACRTVLQFLPGNIGPLGDGGGVQQHLLGVRRSGSRGKELRATRSICELPFGPTHSSPTAQVPCARRALAGVAPRPLLRRAPLAWEGRWELRDASAPFRPVPRRAEPPGPGPPPGSSSSPSSLPLASEAPSSGRVASLQLPCFLLLSWSSSRVGTFLCRFTVIFMRLGTERRQDHVVSAPH